MHNLASYGFRYFLYFNKFQVSINDNKMYMNLIGCLSSNKYKQYFSSDKEDFAIKLNKKDCSFAHKIQEKKVS